MNIDPRLDEIKDCLYRVAVKAVIIERKRVLLIMDRRDTEWSLPGGGVDHGVNLQTTLVRELSEELSIKSSNISADDNVLGVTLGHIKSGVPRCNIHVPARLANTDDILSNGEVENFKWVSIDDLNDIEFDSSAGDPDKLIQIIRSAAELS